MSERPYIDIAVRLYKPDDKGSDSEIIAPRQLWDEDASKLMAVLLRRIVITAARTAMVKSPLGAEGELEVLESCLRDILRATQINKTDYEDEE